MTLEQIFADVLREKVENITDASDPSRHKRWDSFRHIKLVVAIEDAFKVKLSTAEIASMKSFKIARELLLGKGVAV